MSQLSLVIVFSQWLKWKCVAGGEWGGERTAQVETPTGQREWDGDGVSFSLPSD